MAKVWKKLQRADSDYTGNVTGTVDDVAVATIKSGASAGTTAKGVTDTAFTSNVLNVANANAALKNSNVDADHVGLGNVTNESKATMFTSPALTGTPTGITATHVSLGNVANESPSTLKTTMSLNNVANETRATILAGNLTGTVGGTAVATVKSGAASGATANQSSTATILSGNLTGTIGGTANATIKSGAAAGATANQDSSATIRGGTLTGNLTGTIGGTANATVVSGAAKGATAPVTFKQDAIPTALNAGDIWFDTNDGNKQYRATATGNSTISATTWVAVTASKGAIGLGSVDNTSDATKQTAILSAADADDVGLGSVTNESKATMFAGPTFTGTVAGVSATHVGLQNVANESPATLKTTMSLNNVANETRATILAGTLTGNVTGTVGGTAVATIKSGAASGATANQDSTSTIRTGTTKANVGLTSVIDQAITVVSSKLKFGSTTQTLDADKVGGSTLAETKAAAVSTAETNIIGSAPGALNTLDELAAAMNDDASFNSTITTSIATKGKAPMTLTAEDTDGDSTYTNDPANEVVGQLGVYSGDQYCVVDI